MTETDASYLNDRNTYKQHRYHILNIDKFYIYTEFLDLNCGNQRKGFVSVRGVENIFFDQYSILVYFD